MEAGIKSVAPYERRSRPTNSQTFADLGRDHELWERINSHLAPCPDGGGCEVRCKLCGKRLSTLSNGRTHVRQVHFATRVQCVVCQEVVCNSQSFRKHVLRIHGVTGVKNVVETYGKRVEEDLFN